MVDGEPGNDGIEPKYRQRVHPCRGVEIRLDKFDQASEQAQIGKPDLRLFQHGRRAVQRYTPCDRIPPHYSLQQDPVAATQVQDRQLLFINVFEQPQHSIQLRLAAKEPTTPAGSKVAGNGGITPNLPVGYGFAHFGWWTMNGPGETLDL